MKYQNKLVQVRCNSCFMRSGKHKEYDDTKCLNSRGVTSSGGKGDKLFGHFGAGSDRSVRTQYGSVLYI